MPIKIITESYCHDCPEFEPQVDKTTLVYNENKACHTIIKCEHLDRCRCIYEAARMTAIERCANIKE